MPGPGPRSQVQVPGLRPESRGGGEKRRELSVAHVCAVRLRFVTPSLHLDLNMDTVGVSLEVVTIGFSLHETHPPTAEVRRGQLPGSLSFLSSSLYCLHNHNE
jgi:hypothetical protein